jgi:hypothetical protein
MWQGKRRQRASANMVQDDIPLPRSLTRCARSFGCGERYRLTGGRNFLGDGEKSGSEKAAAKPFFHRLRPLTSITKSDAQISGGETRQDYKDPGVSPGGSLVRSPVPAFRFTGVIPLLWPRLSHSTPDTQFREGSSLQAGLYARTPVQSDRCALSGNYRLESNPERHDKAPLAAATGNRFRGAES